VTPAAFVRAHTRLVAPPLVPEIRLHLAEEPYAIWRDVERELGRAEPPLPFWAFAWVGGQALARHVLDHPEAVAGRRALDLASGSGLVAIAAAMAGAAAVKASEVDPFAIAAIELNAAANGVTVAATAEDLLDGDGGGAEVVLAGDVFYERSMSDRVLPFLERARVRGAAVLIGDPGREHLPRRRLEAVAEHDVRDVSALEGRAVRRTTVWRLA
jgi:predicted nicotinamide N-methyase